MLPQLAKVTDDYAIPVYSCSGFNSLTSIRQIVDSVCAEKRNTVIFHLGDYDPSGESIFERIITDVPAFLEVDAPERSFEGCARRAHRAAGRRARAPDGPDHHKGLAVKGMDRQGQNQKCELEALPPDVIAAMLRESVEEHADQGVRDAGAIGSGSSAGP